MLIINLNPLIPSHQYSHTQVTQKSYVEYDHFYNFLKELKIE